MPTPDRHETAASRPGALPADQAIEDVVFREVAAPDASLAGQAPATAESAAPGCARPATERRRIGLHHIAFFRTYLEGLDLADAADRYLDFGRDTPRARRTQRWLLDELVAAARKHKDFATARLLKIRPAAIAPLEVGPAVPGAQPKRQAPSLDDFAAERDPDGFYTEAELLELFTAEFPAGGDSEDPAEAAVRRRQERNARLRAKQLAALAELERLLVEVPKPEHHVLGWFDVSIALKLADVGLNTLRDLVRAVNAAGYRWYRNVPRLGEKGAGRITAWLEANGKALGMPVAQTALARPPRWGQPVALERTPSTSVAPLEYFVLPPSLDGSLGTNRDLDSRNKTEARDDKAAIDWWLRKYAGNANTLARYRTEAERLLLWAVLQKGKALSSLSITDCNEYINTFLPAPAPASMWIMERVEARSHPLWRPFRKGLGYKSRDLALQALKSLCESLTRAHYLDFNPFSEVRLARQMRLTEDGTPAEPETVTSRIHTERSLTHDEWQFAVRFLNSLPPETPATERIRFILIFAYGTGLRRAELAGARTGHITRTYAGPELGTITVLQVIGKGGKERFVPLSPRLLQALSAYLVYRGLPADPQACPAGTPLIPALQDKRELQRVRAVPAGADAVVAVGSAEKAIKLPKLYNAVKRFFDNAAAAAHSEAPEFADAFSRATTHWLRHTFGSHAVAGGMALETARQFLGHASISTTGIYSVADIARQYREVDAFIEASFGA
ncbi:MULTISPECIES: phage integrase family protein [Ralstonia]|jgi:site-specific recombinase XerD|uniref:Site-specific recombinase XerD n=2 Tax=Ralstonia pickettii TaxID=329 RepID=R0DWJ2_RALPI|nr:MULTISPECIES: phage integrase family protein [Ralstonia]ENZ77798.1 site-specific recombinase XerD [Ralstonia pickettii OR214]MCM3582099.1 site-specific integrase [Ralstonia pickettii]